jgi:hypothetical protein
MVERNLEVSFMFPQQQDKKHAFLGAEAGFSFFAHTN